MNLSLSTRVLSRCIGALMCITLVAACGDDDPETPTVPRTTQKVNSFVMAYAKDAYLWNHKVPTDIDISREADPFTLMDRVVYSEYDRWSYLTDDADALFKDYEGISTTYGYRLTVYKFSNAESYFAVVRFVYPGSPAEQAGLERGDILLTMNGTDINAENYMNLYYSPNVTLKTGTVTETGIVPGSKTVAMQAVEMYLDPVNTYRTIDCEGKRVGYLCYTDYVEASHPKLLAIFQDFKNRGVSDVVLDLRYNPGGAAKSARFLASILAPANAVAAGDVLLKEEWNDKYTEYYKARGEDLTEYFNKTIGVNMNLDRLFVLTGSGTASASEATMVGLMPYMDVVQVGETTHGKYCGALLIRPWTDNEGTLDPEIDNWAMSLVVYKFANKNGFTDFKDGLAPAHPIADDWTSAYPLGDERDPMLAKVLEIVGGKPASRTDHTQQSPVLPGKPLPDTMQPDYRRGGMTKK
ncbi:PDZ domain-containing protein [Bacteroides sp. OttesenSCG-928-J23]|nr:PDZ domain-containing protein [Bacteroides sp. OttesenSCG-928-J23]